ncbi:MAG: patatin-like phospholipase family protein [Pseudomonadota bacterium]|nr:patatin-like phospholipase family protein [Pseudomonadota bacterium]
MPDSNPDRLGLCLSGGGFRASLFHIGVLAALAEREMLHRVEVLSTVSGGSIIGAYYYLKVKQLLEGKRPGCPQPAPELYRKIVHEIEVDFLEAIQRNIRLRLLTNPFRNIQLARKDYSRSDRLAELLNEHFYDAVAGKESIKLRDIFIRPDGADVKARDYNADHEYKIPVLVLNATCLNTGHPWHFTGAYVGEPPQRREFMKTVDTNVRLPRLNLQDDFYKDDPNRPLSDKQKHKLAQLTLADAVASSAAVPGVFPPLAIHDLYESGGGDEIVIELSDGGVYDNQGVDALFQNGCSHFVISDASGQLEDERILGTKFFQVVQRSSDVMMNKIRGETLYRVRAGQEVQSKLGADDPLVKENGVVAHALMHLRQAFANTPEQPNFPPPVNRPGGLVYRLSGIRTDLDSFSDAEAKALMYDGYCLAHEHLGAGFAPMSNADWEKDKHWGFLAIRDVLLDPKQLNWLRERLRIGSKQFFRPFRVKPVHAWAVTLALLAVLLPTLWWSICWLYGPEPNAGECFRGFCDLGPLTLYRFEQPIQDIDLHDVGIVLALLVTAILSRLDGVESWLKKLDVLRKLRLPAIELPVGFLFGIAMLVVAAGIWFYRVVYDAMFLKEGRVPRRK